MNLQIQKAADWKSLLLILMDLFTLETDHSSKTAYPVDNSRQTNSTS